MAVSQIKRDSEIMKRKAEKKLAKIGDGHGLYLLVTPQGGTYWRLKYYYAGKEKVLALGVYPGVEIAQARAERDKAKALLRGGKDPGELKRERKHAIRGAAAHTFASVAREWIDKKRHDWSAGHADRVLDSLKENIFPGLGDRAISLITAPELLATVRKMEERGALESAQRVLQRCRAVFAYAIATARTGRNVAADLKGALKCPKRENRAALAASELPEFLRKLDAYDGHLQTSLAPKLQALTFVRPGELRLAEWTEVDSDKAEWRIPRRAHGDAHRARRPALAAGVGDSRAA